MLVAVVLACVAISIGAGVIISKKRFNKRIVEMQNMETHKIDSSNELHVEMNRFEQFKINLKEVQKNIEEVSIPIPDEPSFMDDTESTLNKISLYLEKNSKLVVGTEAFILSVLPTSQTGEFLCAFAQSVPNLMSETFTEALGSLKEGFPVDIETALQKFCEGMLHSEGVNSVNGIIRNGLKEVSGFNDVAECVKHKIGDSLNNISESCTDPSDFTDLDFSGHIPIMTIAISSFREFNLLIDEKTDGITALKNVGLDAAGSGIGGMVGAKAGALVGSFFGPVGGLVGGIVGGITGAVKGRAASNNIKQRPLKRAIEIYQSNAKQMKLETKNKSSSMLIAINQYAIEKHDEFENNKTFDGFQISDADDVVVNIAISLYKSIKENVDFIKNKISKIKSSVWYSDSKYGIVLDNCNSKLIKLESQLPPMDNIKTNPKLALETILALQMPFDQENYAYEKEYEGCIEELKNFNDKNNASILVWSYFVYGLYQKTLNEITDFSNEQMSGFNQFIAQWKQKLKLLEKNINTEKSKLGM